jgi:hypothetical protein
VKARRCKYCHGEIKAGMREHGTSALKKHFNILSHPEISNFRMWIEKIIKQQFSHNFKNFPTFISLYWKYSIGKIIVWFSKSNKKLWVLHSCRCILVLPECLRFQKCI